MRPSRRWGFTLLEVILAAAIGVLLLFALYSAFHMQLRLLNAGRDAVDESVLARAVLARIGNDINSHLAPYVPPPYTTSSSSSSSSGGSGSGSGSGSGTSGSSSSSGGSSGSAGSSSSSSSTSSSSSSGTSTGSSYNATTNSGTLNNLGALGSAAIGSNTVVFNLGVQGDNNQMSLYVCRWPRETVNLPEGTIPPIVGDCRRITYWLGGGSSGSGLCRQEVKISTSDDALTGSAMGSGDEASMVIAEEVQSLQFRYYDGQNWQDSWDGTMAGNMNNTYANGNMIGPPVAIEIKITLAPPGKKASNIDPNDPSIRTYRHVVAIPTANFPLSTNSFNPNLSNNGTLGNNGSNSGSNTTGSGTGQ